MKLIKKENQERKILIKQKKEELNQCLQMKKDSDPFLRRKGKQSAAYLKKEIKILKELQKSEKLEATKKAEFKQEIKIRKLTQKEILSENAEEVIEMIRQAKSYEEIQERFGVHGKYVAQFITDSEHSACAREAQRESAETISRKAELSLLQIQADDTQATVTRQRELAQHYRWLAAKKNPARFGDSTKIQAEVKDTSTTSAWLSEVLSNIDNNK